MALLFNNCIVKSRRRYWTSIKILLFLWKKKQLKAQMDAVKQKYEKLKELKSQRKSQIWYQSRNRFFKIHVLKIESHLFSLHYSMQDFSNNKYKSECKDQLQAKCVSSNSTTEGVYNVQKGSLYKVQNGSLCKLHW